MNTQIQKHVEFNFFRKNSRDKKSLGVIFFLMGCLGLSIACNLIYAYKINSFEDKMEKHVKELALAQTNSKTNAEMLNQTAKINVDYIIAAQNIEIINGVLKEKQKELNSKNIKSFNAKNEKNIGEAQMKELTDAFVRGYTDATNQINQSKSQPESIGKK